MRILVVDDNPVNITLLCSLLGTTGSKYESADCGAKAIEMASSGKYDLIFMDQYMPGINGTDTMKAIRANDALNNRYTKMVCLTANKEAGLKEKFILEGFDDYLAKPVVPAELKNLVFKYGKGNTDQADRSGEIKNQVYLRRDCRYVDMERGIINCGGDGNQFEEVMKIILRYGNEKLGKLEKYFAEHKLDLYTIEVHAMKSNAGTIGAEALAATAAKLEAAAHAGDYSSVAAGHAGFVSEYKGLLFELGELTTKPKNTEVVVEKPADEDAGLFAEEEEYMQTFREILDCTQYGSYDGAADLIEILSLFSLPDSLSKVPARLAELMNEQKYDDIIYELKQLLKHSAKEGSSL